MSKTRLFSRKSQDFNEHTRPTQLPDPLEATTYSSFVAENSGVDQLRLLGLLSDACTRWTRERPRPCDTLAVILHVKSPTNKLGQPRTQVRPSLDLRQVQLSRSAEL